MLVAMFLGMVVIGEPAMLALGAAGVTSAELTADAPALMLLGMGVTMTMPMVAWMRYRGHGWGPSNEMAASMLIPTAGVIGLLGARLVEDVGTLLAIEHAVMLRPSVTLRVGAPASWGYRDRTARAAGLASAAPLKPSGAFGAPCRGKEMTNSDTKHHDVVVVGGGQAGLAIGYFLARRGRDFRIMEAAPEPAAAWRERWDSLKLFTPARYNALPGLAFPGDPDRYPGRDEVVAYLTDYVHHFDLPVELNSAVRAIHRTDGAYLLELDDHTYEAQQVVVATGPFQVPLVPAIAKRLARDVTQLHSTAYRAPDGMPTGPVLVVGGGNTGFQIAEELSHSREVHLSIGSRQTPLPQRILGRDLFWYLDATGLIRKTTASRIGRRMAGRDTLIGSTPRAVRRRYGVQLHGRTVDAAGSTVGFDDGTTLNVDA
jgi:putative flavoprotein involved in K+ transport